MRKLIEQYEYQLKFVIDTLADCQEVESYLAEIGVVDRSRVLLMPQGTDVETLTRTGHWLEPYCRTQHYHFCPRKHIEWFGMVRGT